MGSLAIITPCFNPNEDWETLYLRSVQFLLSKLTDIQVSFVIVNDGSTKNFGEKEVSFLKSKLPSLTLLTLSENKGKGASIRYALHQLSSDYYIYTDIDFPYEPESIVGVLEKLKQGATVVCGVRAAEYYKRIPFQRRVISLIFRALNQYILRLPISDTQTGLKGMNSFGKNILLKTTVNYYLFDLEFILLCRKNKILVESQSVILKPTVQMSNLKFKIILRELISFIRIIFR